MTLTLKKTETTSIAFVPTVGKSLDDLLEREWLLTNNRGGYASSTIIGCNTRRYHGMLIGSLNPPVNRIMALANCMELVIAGQKVYNLSTFEFENNFAPQGFTNLRQFRQDLGVHFDYQLDNIKITKSLYLVPNSDTAAIVYNFTDVPGHVEFTWRPFVNLRDFHGLQSSRANLCSNEIGGGLLIRHDVPSNSQLFISSENAKFEKDPQWWFNFIYRIDRQRGQEFTEDLWTPGFFKCSIDSPAKIVFRVYLARQHKLNKTPIYNIDNLCKDLLEHHRQITKKTKTLKHFAATNKDYLKLALAADKFIVNYKSDNDNSKQADRRTSILAGFPWFADWGRDTFISLPGLLLSTGRFDEAKSVLTSFAGAAGEGMIPNRFDDHTNTAYFNSIDASLWFINAAFKYLNVTEDYQTFTQHLLQTIRRITASYQNGTLFDIHADDDGLITGGNIDTQLTWMDVKCDGVAFTPRYGKAIEINALWYNSLSLLAQFYNEKNGDEADSYQAMADNVEQSFRRLFWNETTGYLNDCILTDGTVDTSLRPNQIFAVSLPFSPLTIEQQKAVVDVVQNHLLTPYGLRTLNVKDTRYKGRYEGPQHQRDTAYHQGTVWPFLIGHFVESYLKVNNFTRQSKAKAAEFIQPLLTHMNEDVCLGQVNEIFDADHPHSPKGCFAQAWSVAELLRAYLMINS